MYLEQSKISLTVVLLNSHDVAGRIFDRWISRQASIKSPLKWHNQPVKCKALLESLSRDFLY